jgi:hypothetical protein
LPHCALLACPEKTTQFLRSEGLHVEFATEVAELPAFRKYRGISARLGQNVRNADNSPQKRGLGLFEEFLRLSVEQNPLPSAYIATPDSIARGVRKHNCVAGDLHRSIRDGIGAEIVICVVEEEQTLSGMDRLSGMA